MYLEFRNNTSYKHDSPKKFYNKDIQLKPSKQKEIQADNFILEINYSINIHRNIQDKNVYWNVKRQNLKILKSIRKI